MKQFIRTLWLMVMTLLTVSPALGASPKDTTIVVRICDGDVVERDGITLSTEGTYPVTLVANDGSDSTINYIVQLLHPYISEERRILSEGSSFVWHGQTISTAGIYTANKVSATHCDTIYRLIVEQYETIREKNRVCEDDMPYLWHGKQLTKAGTYRILDDPDGEMRYYELELIVPKRTYATHHFRVCNNEAVSFNGRIYPAGDYNDTLVNTQGCDSIVRISVQQIKTDTIHTYAKISEGQTYTWHYGQNTQTQQQTGVYYESIPYEYDGITCDSVVYVLHLNVYPSYYIDTTATVCERDLPYFFHGTPYHKAGTYQERLETAQGFDSIYTLTLQVQSPVEQTLYKNLCQGNSFDFGGHHITSAGVYSDTITSLVTGCDSIVTVYVEERERYLIEETHVIAENEAFIWGVTKETYTQPGDYTRHFLTEECQCDSVHILHLLVYPSFHMDTVAEVCQTELPFLWHGMSFTASGDYLDQHSTIHGLDSIYTLHLTVRPIVIEDVELRLCKGDTIYYNGKSYMKGGIYEDADNCERAYRITVKEYVPRTYETEAWIHGDQTYYWKYGKNNELEKTFTLPGVYSERVLDVESGCYDTYKLYLHKGNTFLSEETVTICEGEKFIWRGRDLSLANVGRTQVYYDSLQTILGNDSIYKLTLTIGRQYNLTQTLSVCKGGTITWNGHTYQAGMYIDTLHTVLGCDSIIQTIVNEENTYYIEENATITAGESISWNGKQINKDGDYYYYGRTQSGCDSTLVLHVTVLPAQPESWLITEKASICEDESYTWRGRKFYTSGTYYDSLKCVTPAQAGKDSVYMLQLTVYPKYKNGVKHLYSCDETPIVYLGTQYTTADEGVAHEIVLHTIHGCDSIINLYVHFNEHYEHFDTLRFRNDEVREWQGRLISQSGDYTANYVSKNGCDSVYHLHAEVENVYLYEVDTTLCETEAPFEWMGLTIPRMRGSRSYEITQPIVVDGVQHSMLYRINVTMYPVVELEKSLSFCDGSSVSYYGKVYDQPGEDIIVIKSQYGCDSTIHVHINQLPSYHNVTEAYINTYKKGKYSWLGTTYDKAGTYIIQSENEFGCANIDELVLKEIPVRQDTQIVCANDLPYVWRNHSYEHSCDVEDFDRDEFGVDTAMYTLHLEVRRQYESYQQINLCEGSTITFLGKVYDGTIGKDTIRLKSQDLCDSLIIVTISQYPSYHAYENKYLRPGDTIRWYGQEITEPGRYLESTQTENGCDDIKELFVQPLVVDSMSTTICEGDVFEWLGGRYSSDGLYLKPEKDIHGADSAEHRLLLTVVPQARDTIEKTLCYGEKFTYADTIWSGDVDTTIYVPQQTGCDMIVRIILHETKPYSYDSVVYLRDWQTLDWHDRTLPINQQYKMYYDTIQSQYGCDSIYYSMDVRRMDSIAHDTIICQYDMPYYWEYNQQTYYHSDTIDYILQDSLGRDSVIHTLNLKVMEVYDTTIVAKICDNQLPYQYIIPGHVFEHDATGIYNDTIPSAKYGVCDSIYNFHLTVYPSVNVMVDTTICETQLPYIVATDTIWNEGFYTISTQTQECGCDSTVNLRLHIRPTMTRRDSVIMCKEDLPYYLGDTIGVRHRYPKSQYHGLPFYTDTIIWDCDSTYYFHVIVRDPIQMADIYFCDGDSIQFGFHNDGSPRWIKETGTYYDSIQSHDVFSQTMDNIRCDSILRVNAYKLRRDTVDRTIHILNDSTYEFYGRQLSMTGIYTAEDTLITAKDWVDTDVTKRRCNDLIRLHLIVDTVYRFRDSIHVCLPVDSFFYHQWPGGHFQGDDGFLGPDGQKKRLKIAHSGIYTDSLRREVTRLSSDNYYKNFRDSIYTLVVTMDTAYFRAQTYNLCEGDSILFKKQCITSAGVYRDTLSTINGCDSIIQLVVNMIPSYRIRLADARISDKMTPYIWKTADSHGTTHTHHLLNTGTYYDTLRSVRDCDSIVELHLEVAKSYLYSDTTHVCSTYAGQEHSYRFRDSHEMTFSHAGHYYDSLHTVNANPRWEKDSIYHLYVIEHLINRTRKDTIICRDDSIMFNGHYIRHEGIFLDTIPTMPTHPSDTCHCDSIIEWNIIFAEHYMVNEGVQFIPHDGQYIWHFNHQDTILRTEGVYYDRYTSRYGCDSIFRIEIKFADTYLNTSRDDVCQSELPYRWHGRDLYKTGTYYDSLQTVNGFDSIYMLNLHVLDTTHVYIQVTDCKGDSTLFNGRWLTKPGEYTDTLTSIRTGCDSIVHLRYRHLSTYYMIETAKTDDQTPYVWKGHGKTFTHSGVYYDSLKTLNGNGCDSIYELRLTVYPTYHYDESVTVCRSELPYEWMGVRKYYAVGNDTTWVEKFQTTNGYDSIYTLHMHIMPTDFGDTLVRICEGDSAYVHGRYISRPGNYTDTLTSVQFGCDSIVRVTVANINRIHQTQNIKLCQDDQFTLKSGFVVKNDGIYHDTLTSFVTGCDSVITYNIQFIQKYVDEYTKEITDKESIDFFGETVNQPGSYQHTEKAKCGCDSVITIMNLIVWPTYSRDTTIRICESELPLYWQGYTINEVVTDKSYSRRYSSIHGADSIFTLHLTVLPVQRTTMSRTLCQGDKFTMYNGREITESGLYYDTLGTASGCDSIVAVSLYFTPARYDEYNREISDKDSIRFFDQWIRQPGTYHHVDTAQCGCDSVITIMNLTVWSTYSRDTTIRICESELPLYWQNYTINEVVTDKTYTRRYSSIHGADSIFTLHLTVLPVQRTTMSRTLCQGDKFTMFNGREITESGLYYDTLGTASGCDSIVAVSLYFTPVRYDRYDREITDKDSIRFFGQWIRQPGAYQHVDTAQCGCDSLITIMNLTVWPTYSQDTTIMACESDLPIYWQGYTINELVENKTYRRHYTSIHGADSIHLLHLTVLPVQRTISKIDLCQGETYTLFNGTVVSTGGQYNDTLTSVRTGCDSIVTRDVRINQVHNVEHSYVLPEDSVLNFYGQRVSHDGTYVHYDKTSFGCDSIVTIHVTYAHAYDIKVRDEVCFEDLPYQWGGRQYYKSKKDTIVYKSIHGMDSVVSLDLIVHDQVETKTINVSLCHGDTYSINYNRVIREAGIYYDTLQSVHGCDSITKFVVNYYPRYNINVSDTICQGDTLWFGKETATGKREYFFTEKGNYILRLKSINDCDSIINIHLTVNPSYFYSTLELITEDQLPHFYESKLYEQGGIYETRYATVLGCDSTYRYELRIVDDKKASPWDTLYLCGPDASLNINGRIIDKPGRYQFEKRSKGGTQLDSLYRIEVLRSEPYDTYISREICQGETVDVGGHIFNTTGNFVIRLTSQQGCDSVVHMDLKVHPSYDIHQKATIIDYNAPYHWMGKDYKYSGTYIEQFNTTYGCDSICTLDLTVIETQEIRDTVSLCITDLPYRWSRTRQDYYVGGLYADTVFANEDSKIYLLELIVAEPTIVTYMPKHQTVCADDVDFPLDFTYTGSKPEVYSLFFDAKAKAQGFSDVKEEPFNRGIHVQIPQFDLENRYVRPDQYTMQLLLDNGTCDRTLYDVTILVQYPSWIMEQNWSNTVSLLSKDYNGGYTFSGYRWYVDGVYQPDEMKARLRSNLLHPGSEVYVELARQGESYYVPSCSITIEAVDEAASSEIPVLVITPNNTPKDAPLVRIMARENVQYRVFSQSGQMIEEGHMPKGENSLLLPATSGCYFIWAITDSGDATTEKVLVY